MKKEEHPIVEEIRQYAQRRNLSLHQLDLGVSEKTLANIVLGAKTPRKDTVDKIRAAMKLIDPSTADYDGAKILARELTHWMAEANLDPRAAAMVLSTVHEVITDALHGVIPHPNIVTHWAQKIPSLDRWSRLLVTQYRKQRRARR